MSGEYTYQREGGEGRIRLSCVDGTLQCVAAIRYNGYGCNTNQILMLSCSNTLFTIFSQEYKILILLFLIEIEF